jgi:alpha-ribazole phosphatase/probable phosphoglycerate mutase
VTGRRARPGGVAVFCLRHAESENVVAGAAGVLPLSPLTRNGAAQALAAAGVLAAEGLTRVYCSTAVRARETAAVLADRLGLDRATDVVVMPELDEVGIGSAEGATDPVTRRRTAEVLHAWVVGGDLDQRVADGESGHEVLARVCRALETIGEVHDGEAVAVVGHVASLTAGLSALCGLGGSVWGVPLPHAIPFLVKRDGLAWSCDVWPGGT